METIGVFPMKSQGLSKSPLPGSICRSPGWFRTIAMWTPRNSSLNLRSWAWIKAPRYFWENDGKWSCFTMENATEHAILKSNTWYNIGGSIKNHWYVVWYASGIVANHVASGSVGNCGYQLGPSHIWQFNGENDDDQLDFGWFWSIPFSDKATISYNKLHVAQVWTILLPCEATIFCLKILIWLQRMSVGWMPTNPKSTHVTTLRSGSRLWWRMRWWNGRMITKSTLTFRPLSAEGVLFQSFSFVLGTCFISGMYL